MVKWMRWHFPPHDSKFVPKQSEAQHATSRSGRLFPILNHYEWAGEETLCFLETWKPDVGSSPRSPTFQLGSFSHCTRAPAKPWHSNMLYLKVSCYCIFPLAVVDIVHAIICQQSTCSTNIYWCQSTVNLPPPPPPHTHTSYPPCLSALVCQSNEMKL